MKISIRSHTSGDVLFELDTEPNSLKWTVEAAVADGVDMSNADLRGADLRDADLRGAKMPGVFLAEADLSDTNLRGADLSGAYMQNAILRNADVSDAQMSGALLRRADLSKASFCGTDLSGADLIFADLRHSDLSGADLCHAYWTEADLRYADLRDARLTDDLTLVGERPYMLIGPIGSRGDYMESYATSQGTWIRTGCFFGSRDEFAARVEETHGDTRHGREYRAALALIDLHTLIWGYD
jgi:uncharacterized protein YjbI with pentapeptide repeats